MDVPSVDMIKERYPDAQSCNNQDPTYCVGGAFIMAAKKHRDPAVEHFRSKERFPSVGLLVDHLVIANPNLKTHRQYHGDKRPDCCECEVCTIARSIIAANDDRQYKEAWRQLDHALTIGR